MSEIKKAIESGKTYLGVEFGSTRIKAVLIDGAGTVLAAGDHEWENQLVDGIWTYDMADVWTGLQDAYARLKANVAAKYGVTPRTFGAIGFSAMMHGYLPFNKDGKQLVPFRTWRNTITGDAAGKLTDLFGFNIPQRWSIAHLYQAILNKEPHVGDVDFITTLEGYVHWMLTGKKVLGVGEASGMFPIDSNVNQYDARMVEKFDELVAPYGFGWKLGDILPIVLTAGEDAGVLTKEGALRIDPTGDLEAGIALCPPEGDAGTGMVATNAVAARTGNVSAGTSVFAMLVLEKALKKVHPEIDMVTTPSGKPVAMVHCNNCTSDLNAWVGLFGEFAKALGVNADAGTLFGTLYNKAMEADADLGGLMACNYYSGEHITGFTEGRPLFVRLPGSRFTLANFMRTHLYAALASLKIGMDILIDEEQVRIDTIYGHGGLFKTKGVGQSILAAAIDTPVSVMETAGEGGAWGIAILAAYLANKAGRTLEDYLNEVIFAGKLGEKMSPAPEDKASFNAFIERFKSSLPVERAAVECVK